MSSPSTGQPPRPRRGRRRDRRPGGRQRPRRHRPPRWPWPPTASDTLVITRYRPAGRHAPGAHHQPAHHGGAARPRRRGGGGRRGHPAGPDGQQRLLHLASPGRSSAGCAPGAPDPTGRPTTPLASPDPDLRHAAGPAWSRCCSRTPQSRGARVRFDTEYLSLTQDDDGVTVAGPRPACAGDELRDPREVPRSAPTAAARGSPRTPGLPLRGPDGRRRLDQHRLRGRPRRTCVAAPARASSTGCCSPARTSAASASGLVRMVRPWNEWLIVWGYDIDGPAPDLDRGVRAVDRPQAGRRRRPPGRDRESSSAWTVNHTVRRRATRTGRVFCAGRRRAPPPAVERAGLQHLDPGRLQPGLEARRSWCAGRPAPELLDSYYRRARPGRQAGGRPRPTSPSARPARIFDALGPAVAPSDPEEMVRQHGRPQRGDPGGREAARGAARGDRVQGLRVQRPRRRAEPALRLRRRRPRRHRPSRAPPATPSCTTTPRTRPGAKLPHAWLTTDHRRQVSTLDLVGHGRFTVVTGIGGEGWVSAADAVGAELGLDVATALIGPGRDLRRPRTATGPGCAG